MPKILLVDDNDMFRESVFENLKAEGFDVTTAANGRLADEILRQETFDLVISDVQMPEMDGVALTKSTRTHSQVPIILMTGFSAIIEACAAYQIGATDFLPKPFKREELLAAIENCLTPQFEVPSNEEEFCKLGINDFVSGRTIKFSIFVRLSPKKFIKLAHKGEDLSLERIHFYRKKGLHFLYLRREDFRQYIGFNIQLANTANRTNSLNLDKKLNLLRHTGEILGEHIRNIGVDESLYEATVAFVEASLNVISDDVEAIDLLDSLRKHADHILVHSVAVSLYSVMIAQNMEWNLPINRFKLAMGGLFHDVGMKELSEEQLRRPRYDWTVEEVKQFESHPLRSLAILSQIRSIPQDVRDIVKHHHENALSKGFPAALKKSAIHPMAKVVAVADEFCYRVIRGPHSAEEMGAVEAVQEMIASCSQLLDKKCFEALASLFKVELPKSSVGF